MKDIGNSKRTYRRDTQKLSKNIFAEFFRDLFYSLLCRSDENLYLPGGILYEKTI
jgi:hypothetical protein